MKNLLWNSVQGGCTAFRCALRVHEPPGKLCASVLSEYLLSPLQYPGREPGLCARWVFRPFPWVVKWHVWSFLPVSSRERLSWYEWSPWLSHAAALAVAPRCIGGCTALHRRSHRAAFGIAPRCVGDCTALRLAIAACCGVLRLWGGGVGWRTVCSRPWACVDAGWLFWFSCPSLPFWWRGGLARAFVATGGMCPWCQRHRAGLAAMGSLALEKKERGASWMRPFYDTLGVVSDYSATTAAVSAAAVSAAAVSTATVSSAIVSQHTLSESAQEPCSVLLPQEANDTATMAANTNANFFISLCF